MDGHSELLLKIASQCFSMTATDCGIEKTDGEKVWTIAGGGGGNKPAGLAETGPRRVIPPSVKSPVRG
jgi:hypothetical protein